MTNSSYVQRLPVDTPVLKEYITLPITNQEMMRQHLQWLHLRETAQIDPSKENISHESSWPPNSNALSEGWKHHMQRRLDFSRPTQHRRTTKAEQLMRGQKLTMQARNSFVYGSSGGDSEINGEELLLSKADVDLNRDPQLLEQDLMPSKQIDVRITLVMC